MAQFHLATKRKRRETRKPLYVFAAVCAGLFVLLGVTRMFSSYHRDGMVSGFFSIAHAADVVFDEADGLFRSKKSLIKENVILKQKIKILEESVATVAAVEKENLELKIGRASCRERV